jgi:hypothetical protein
MMTKRDKQQPFSIGGMLMEEDFEVDDISTVCENCLNVDEDVSVTFDHWSGRNLCLDCEPHPMMDDGTRR